MPATDLMSIQRAPPALTEGMPLEGPTVGDGTSDWSADTRGCSHADGSLLGDRAGGLLQYPPQNLTHLVTFVLARALCQTSHDL